MRELLEELATEARPYDGIDRAVRAMRRRRRLVRLTPFAVAAVVAAAVTLTYISVNRPDGNGATITTTAVSWLPTQLTIPRDPPPRLPTDRGVGPAALVYLPQDVNDLDVLVTAIGEQFRLPDGPERSLSPDGRWLVSIRDAKLIVRDLTGVTELEVGDLTGGTFEAAWSSDSDLMVVSQGEDATVVDLPAGTSHPVTIGAGRYVCGVQDAGDLLVCSVGPAPDGIPTLSRVDARTGTTKASVTLRIADALNSDERTAQGVYHLIGSLVVPMAGAQTVLVRTARYDADHGVLVWADLLDVDANTGEFITRFVLPRQETGATKPSNGGVAYAIGEARTVATALPDVGILLLHIGPLGGGDDAYVETVRTVEVLNPITGDRAVAMTVTGGVRAMVLRGQ